MESDRGHEQEAPIPVENHQAGEVRRRRRVVDQKGAHRATVQAMGRRFPLGPTGQPEGDERDAAQPARRHPCSEQLAAQQDPHHESRDKEQGKTGARFQHRADQNQQACLDGGGHDALASREIWSPRPRSQPDAATVPPISRIRRSKIRSGATVQAAPISIGGSVRGCPSAPRKRAPPAPRVGPCARRC